MQNAYITCVEHCHLWSPCRLIQREPIWGHRAGEPVLPAVFALLSWRRYYQGSCSRPSKILNSDSASYLNDCENVFNDFSVFRPRGPASSGRIQAGALSCWTCGEPTSRPTAPAAGGFRLHPSSALPPLPLGLNRLPGIPTAAPAAGYQRCVFECIF